MAQFTDNRLQIGKRHLFKQIQKTQNYLNKQKRDAEVPVVNQKMILYMEEMLKKESGGTNPMRKIDNHDLVNQFDNLNQILREQQIREQIFENEENNEFNQEREKRQKELIKKIIESRLDYEDNQKIPLSNYYKSFLEQSKQIIKQAQQNSRKIYLSTPASKWETVSKLSTTQKNTHLHGFSERSSPKNLQQTGGLDVVAELPHVQV